MSVFGDRLKTLRQKTGATQKELASKLGVSSAAYSLWEKGEREPKFEIIEKLCAFFGVTADFLMGRTDDNPDREWNFERYLASIGYNVYRDDPEHKPFLITPHGVFALEYGDIRHFMEISEAYLTYTIDNTLKNREKIRNS
ncbi:MAG: helix-turn-helix domain-containing protein [Hungatella sp.]|nr:helix-turn-helix domain-containing protein [Hungatella sp.]